MRPQYIFSDGTYNKPFFLVYVNTSCFAISLIPLTVRYVKQNGVDGLVTAALRLWREKRSGLTLLKTVDEERRRGGTVYDDGDATDSLLVDDEASLNLLPTGKDEKLSLSETARLSLEFSLLWFAANYFASACLEYTSVGSVTILTSTSSIWTLVFGALTGVEIFTLRKLIGVLASLAGVVLISSVDLSGANDDTRGSFPHKTTAQIAIGDSMAFFSAIIYGVYVTVMKRRVGNEERVNMPLFFGLVGLFNVLFLWPGFFILHYTGIEPFELPPTASVWTIIAVSSRSACVRTTSRADNIPGQLDGFLLQRHPLGVCHVAHYAACCHCRLVAEHPPLVDWRDDSILSVFELALLGGGWSRVCFLFGCQQ